MASLGERITLLRKQKNISQTDLAEQCSSSREAIGKYERGEASPSLDAAKRMAEVLDVTLDYLAGGNAAAAFDKQTIRRMTELEKLSEQDKQAILFALDALLRDAKARKTYGK
jgi:transcriptional regulator with XRE-family HTH domain